MKLICRGIRVVGLLSALAVVSLYGGCRRSDGQSSRDVGIAKDRYPASVAISMASDPGVMEQEHSVIKVRPYAGSCPVEPGGAFSNLVSNLKTNFSILAARTFSDAVAHRVVMERSNYVRTGLFMEYSASIAQIIMPRLALYEDGIPLAKIQVASNDFSVVGYLIERAWNLGADPRVGIPLSFNELPRISYARKYASLWQTKNAALAKLYLAHVQRLERLATAGDGPVRADFEHLCRTIEAEAAREGPLRDVAERWKVKKHQLDAMKAVLGYYPAWAQDWLRDNPPPDGKKQ